jgi:hypothetical protein
LILSSWRASSPFNGPDDGLSAFVNMNVLNRDLLRALAAVSIEDSSNVAYVRES